MTSFTSPKKHNGEDTLNAILEWNSAEVWLYLYMRGLPINPAYAKGNKRVGCLLCPERQSALSTSLSSAILPPITAFISTSKTPMIRLLRQQGKIDDPSLGNIWVARKNGNGLLIPCTYEDIKEGDEWVLTCREDRLARMDKNFGILLNDKKPVQH